MHNLKAFNADEAYTAMTSGDGLFVVENFLSREACEELKEVTLRYKPDHLGTVRCLLDKSKCFEDILLHPDVQRICTMLFGKKYRLGSLDIKILEPKEQRDEAFVMRPHVDFPGTDMIGKDEGPSARFYGVPLALKAFIPLSDLTAESGATVYIPGSHKWHRDPELHGDEFAQRLEQGETSTLSVPAGSLALWAGPLWHADLNNESSDRRFLTHICITPDFVAKPQSIVEMYPSNYLKSCDGRLKEILGVEDAFPTISLKTKNNAELTVVRE